MHLALSRLLTSLGAASLLAACSSTGGSVSAGAGAGSLVPQSFAAQAVPASSARSVLDHDNRSSLHAAPASLEFAAGATASQTVSISGGHGGTYDVSIAGTGTCPAVSTSSVKLKHADDDGGDRDHHGDGDRNDAHAATLTVTPVAGGSISRGGATGGSGAAQCIITIAKHDRDAADDAAEHENEKGGVTLLIPVNVDGPVAPPSATPAPCGARGC